MAIRKFNEEDTDEREISSYNRAKHLIGVVEEGMSTARQLARVVPGPDSRVT